MQQGTEAKEPTTQHLDTSTENPYKCKKAIEKYIFKLQEGKRAIQSYPGNTSSTKGERKGEGMIKIKSFIDL